jgi:hypothetical protein
MRGSHCTNRNAWPFGKVAHEVRQTTYQLPAAAGTFSR